MIPAQAVEAAATALIREQSGGCYTYHPEGHSKRDDMDRYAEKHARAALEAAAPYMWDAVAADIRHDMSIDQRIYVANRVRKSNPYRPTA